jgi:hypothetical protein
LQKEGGATHLTNEAKNTFYRKTFLLPLGQNMFSTKKILFVTREPVNENRPNEELYFNGLTGGPEKKKWGSKRRVEIGKDGKCNFVISCSKRKVYYVMSNCLYKQNNSHQKCIFSPLFLMVPFKAEKTNLL